jgi:cytochrome P450
MFRDGHFLAATQIANCMVYLLDHPAAGSAAGAPGTPQADVVEELLRLCPAITTACRASSSSRPS